MEYLALCCGSRDNVVGINKLFVEDSNLSWFVYRAFDYCSSRSNSWNATGCFGNYSLVRLVHFSGLSCETYF